MELLFAFAFGMGLGAALGAGVVVLLTWTREKIERERGFGDFAGEVHRAVSDMTAKLHLATTDFSSKLHSATDSMRTLFVSEITSRRQAFGVINEQLNNAAKQGQQILQVTHLLSQALAHPSLRGQWGERMLEDVLRPTGFQEGVNYLKQTSMETTADRPDFTFLLPRGLKVNLDSKFPLDNYLAYYQSRTDEEKREYKKRFLADVRRRIKEVASRGYINPAESTVDFVLVFIPNEQVYGFINAFDSALFDDAITNKVVLCSPWTLYPVLSIIRIAIDNFVLEKTTAAMLPLMGNFEKQWEAFNECLEKMGRRIADSQKEYEQLVGTRHRQMDKVLIQIETLRQQTDFHAAEDLFSRDGQAPRLENT